MPAQADVIDRDAGPIGSSAPTRVIGRDGAAMLAGGYAPEPQAERPAGARRPATARRAALEAALLDYHASANPLLNASSDLVALAAALPTLPPPADADAARAEIARALVDLKHRLVALDYPPSVAENCCLLFAIALDEFILLSDWAAETDWQNLTLVADLFGFRDGGDRFYEVADRALMQPKALRDLLELIHLLLKLNYRGRCVSGRDQERDRLVRRLEAGLALSPRPDAAEPIGRPPVKTTPMRNAVDLGLQIAAALVLVAGLQLGSSLAAAEAERTTDARLAALRAEAEAQQPRGYVYDSRTGVTKALGRD